MSRVPELSRSFAVRRSFRNTVIFYLAFGVFGILGLVLLVRGETAGWILFGFAAAFLTLLLLVNFKPGWAYLIDRSGITIRRPLKPGHIPREAIAELRVVTDREAVAVVYPDQVEQVRSTRNVDIRSAFRAQRRIGKTVGFSSVPIVFKETRAGGPLDVEQVGARTSGDFILVSTSEGDRYLLSPLDPKGFLQVFEATDR